MRYLILAAALMAAPVFGQDAPKPSPEALAINICRDQRNDQADQALQRQTQLQVLLTQAQAEVAALKAKLPKDAPDPKP